MSWGLITELGHVAIQTRDLNASIFDATQILGLRVTYKEDGVVHLAADDVQHELIYVQSEYNAVDHFGLIARDTDALTEIRRRVLDAGYELLSDDSIVEGIDGGFSFVGPEDFVYFIYLKRPEQRASSLGFGPNRYGHINIHPQNLEAYKDFLINIFEFRISDIIGDDFAYFLRCNSDHHGIALIKGRGTLHHHAWEAQSIVELGKLGDRLDRLDRELIWGPIRHGAGENIASYYVESTGVVVELYTDLEQIYDDNRPPIIWDGSGHKWFNRWANQRTEDFRTHGIFPAPRESR